MAKKWEPCFMCSKSALGVRDDRPMCCFVLFSRLRVLLGASSISEIEEAAGSTLKRARSKKGHLGQSTHSPNAHFEHIKQGSHILAIFIRVTPYEFGQNCPKNEIPGLGAQNVRGRSPDTVPCAPSGSEAVCGCK